MLDVLQEQTLCLRAVSQGCVQLMSFQLLAACFCSCGEWLGVDLVRCGEHLMLIPGSGYHDPVWYPDRPTLCVQKCSLMQSEYVPGLCIQHTIIQDMLCGTLPSPTLMCVH